MAPVTSELTFSRRQLKCEAVIASMAAQVLQMGALLESTPVAWRYTCECMVAGESGTASNYQTGWHLH